MVALKADMGRSPSSDRDTKPESFTSVYAEVKEFILDGQSVVPIPCHEHHSPADAHRLLLGRQMHCAATRLKHHRPYIKAVHHSVYTFRRCAESGAAKRVMGCFLCELCSLFLLISLWCPHCITDWWKCCHLLCFCALVMNVKSVSWERNASSLVLMSLLPEQALETTGDGCGLLLRWGRDQPKFW